MRGRAQAGVFPSTPVGCGVGVLSGRPSSKVASACEACCRAAWCRAFVTIMLSSSGRFVVANSRILFLRLSMPVFLRAEILQMSSADRICRASVDVACMSA